MAKIPPALDSDTDDVAWALQTANTLWERGDRQDALNWLRRAAQAAAETDDDTRAFDLARAAAELVEIVEGATAPPPPPDPAAVPSPPFDAEELPSIDAQIAASAVEPSFDSPNASAAVERVSMDVDEEAEEEVVTSAPPLKLLDRARQDDDIAQMLVSPSAPRAALPSRPVLDADQFDAGLPPVPPVAEPTLSSEAGAGEPPPVPVPAPPPSDLSVPISSAHAVEEEPGDGGMEDVTQMLAEAAVEPPEPKGLMPRAPEPSLVELEPISLDPDSLDPATESATAKAPPPPPKLAPPPPPKLVPPPPPKLAPPPPPKLAPPPPPKLAPPPPPEPTEVPDVEPETITASEPETIAATTTPEPVATPESPAVLEAAPQPDEAPSEPAEEIDEGPAEVASTASVEPEQEPPLRPSQFVVPPPPTVERGLRTRRPSQLPRRGTKAPPLEFDEPLVPEGLAPTSLPEFEEPPEPIPEPEPVQSAPDLSDVEDFADMTEETRRAFEREAVIHMLQTDEEISGFGLAWVAEGQVAVMGLISDMSAVRLDVGAVLRSRGTVDESVPLRLVCTSEAATVAVWSDEDVARRFEALPWVEDELRERADRAHALIGVTLGPLGESFGQVMHEEITARLMPRHYVEGETIVEAGQPLPGLVILGVGKLEVLDADGVVARTLDVGTILFPTSLLTMGDAPGTARAGEGGAVVLMADLTTAQEMIMTFPPLLEQLTRG